MERILVIRLSAMGDAAMVAPVVRELCGRYPQVEALVLTNPFFQPFFRGIDRVSFVPFDKKGRHKGVAGLFRLFADIRRGGGVDAVADLHDVMRTQLLRTLFFLSGKRVAFIHKGRCGKKRLTARGRCKVLKPLKTTPQRYADVFTRLGYPVDVPVTLKRVEAPIPAIAGEKHGAWIGIAPFAQHRGKIYPADRMERVVAALSRRPGTRLFIFGGGDAERRVGESWQARYDNVLSVIGKIKLGEELDLMANLDCVVSMDSAAMHMASLVGVPVVSVWGATHPFAGFMGVGQSAENAVQVDLPCRPCSVYGNVTCPEGYPCLNLIEPQTIVNRVETNL